MPMEIGFSQFTPETDKNERDIRKRNHSPDSVAKLRYQPDSRSNRISIDGRRVMEAAIAPSTTKMAPSQIDIKMLKGISNIPIKANTTVIPLNTTALPAVDPARPTASILSKP